MTVGARKNVRQAADGPSETSWSSDDGAATINLGDSLELMKELPSGSVDCIWTDPPYLLSNGGVTCVAGKMVNVDKGAWDRSRGVEADHDFNLSWIAECHRLLKPAGTIWVSGTTHVYLSVGMALLQSGFRILNDIIWEKPAPPPNLACRCFTHSTETILWATKAPKTDTKNRYVFNYDAMKRMNAGRQMKNVWRISPPGVDEKYFGKHPTQKPVSLIERCLLASTRKGDIILDPFAGSATTGVACTKLRRKFIGFEREKKFFDLSISRLRASIEATSQPQLNL